MTATMKVTNLQNESSATPNIVLNADGSTTMSGAVNVGGGNISPQTSFKNRIINGAMTIDQRRAGAAFTVPSASLAYSVDRFFYYTSDAYTYTSQQVTDAPSGFTNSLSTTFATTFTPSATSDGPNLSQWIEGYNIADLGWGTASAQPITISFWIKSGVTGTHGMSVINAGGTYGYPVLYTVDSANTWEYKTLTIAGPTAGTWNTTNGGGILLRWYFSSGANFTATPNAWSARSGAYQAANSIFGYMPTGAVNVAQSGNVFKVSGVQLEKGSTATPFEFRSIGQELALCQRYYEVVNNQASGGAYSALNLFFNASFQVYKRATPTMTSVANGSYVGNGGINTISATIFNSPGQSSYRIDSISFVGSVVAGYMYMLRDFDHRASAEL